MAVRTSEEFLTMIRQRVGDSTSDEDIAFIEDASDTISSMSQHETEIERLRAENEDLRKKYRDRFFDPKPDEPEPGEPEPEKLTFDSLFDEGGK